VGHVRFSALVSIGRCVTHARLYCNRHAKRSGARSGARSEGFSPFCLIRRHSGARIRHLSPTICGREAQLTSNKPSAARSGALARLGMPVAIEPSMSNAKPTIETLKARRATYLAKLLGSLPRKPAQTLVRPSSDRRIR
jgi:hypothetical protein